jgi:tetratricopeptide (TPR) repeat protein
MKLVLLALFSSQLFAATPAELAIKQANAAIEKQPDHYPYYNSLATAYARRARETSDVEFYAKAAETLQKSFAISPDNFEGLKVKAWLELGRHEFAKALETATRLNKIAPDDISVYGYLVDANAELGNYKDAVAAAQWMLDLRPGNVAGSVRASCLREVYGNLSGALEMIQMAYDSTPPSETEDRAWLLTQTAHLELVAGDLAQAETDAAGALTVFPNYHDALAALAQVRIAQARYDDAVSLLRKCYDAAPHAGDLYALAEAQELASHHQDAAASFKMFELLSLAESELDYNSNRELIAYYVDHANQPEKALEIAKREAERRHDVFTLDAYASALAANGDYAGANAQIQKALALGDKDQKLWYHAGFIALHLQQTEKAEMYLKDAASRHSREASQLLNQIQAKSLASLGAEQIRK